MWRLYLIVLATLAGCEAGPGGGYYAGGYGNPGGYYGGGYSPGYYSGYRYRPYQYSNPDYHWRQRQNFQERQFHQQQNFAHQPPAPRPAPQTNSHDWMVELARRAQQQN